MFDSNSFDQNAFDINAWLMDMIAAAGDWLYHRKHHRRC